MPILSASERLADALRSAEAGRKLRTTSEPKPRLASANPRIGHTAYLMKRDIRKARKTGTEDLGKGAGLDTTSS